MRRMFAIWKKELRSYFTSAVAYIFLFLFLLLSSFMFFVMPSMGGRGGYRGNFFVQGEASLTDYFATFPIALAFFVPILCIKMWPEEYKSGTIEVLMTLPVRAWEVVVGKFMAMLTILAAAFLMSLTVPWSVSWLAVEPLDRGPIVGGYVAAMLMGGADRAIGIFVTAFTREAVTGLLLSLATCLALAFAGTSLVDLVTPASLSESFKFVGFSVRYESIEKGVLDLRDMVYFLSFIATFLVLNVTVLEYRRLK